MLEQTVDCDLVALHVEDAVGHPRLLQQPGGAGDAEESFSGLSTKQLPHASAGAHIHMEPSGKLKGVMPAATPGAVESSRRRSRSTPAPKAPLTRVGMPQRYSITSSPRVTSPRASDGTLPCSRVRIFAISSRRSWTSSGRAHRLSAAREAARQAGNARLAAATAASISSTEASDHLTGLAAGGGS